MTRYHFAHEPCDRRGALSGVCMGHGDANAPARGLFTESAASPLHTALRECADAQWMLGCSDTATTVRR